jgi:geranylgeranyl diphosphate synthase, type I
MITTRDDVDLFSALADERAALAAHLCQHCHETLGEAASYLNETSEYVLAAPGKLLRPLLLLDACRAAGGDPDCALPAALGTEYGHIASLIHDDIMDGDELRRGRETVHVRFGLNEALLTGDLLIFQTFLAYTQCAERGVEAERVLAAIRTLSQTCIAMCRGQALEASIANRLDTSPETYLEMIRLKTASLCQAVTRIGARLGGASDDVVTALGRYGLHLGTAFQITDDVLSYDGNSAAFGKSRLSDLRNRRVTLPIIYAMRDGTETLRRRIETIFTGGKTSDEHDGDGSDGADGAAAYARLVEALHSAGGLARARGLAQRYTKLAQRQLDLLPYTAARERLRALAALFATRDH